MGLACSNIRLLTLTARKADCEYGISVASMRKMAVTREQSALAQEYNSKLQSKSIAYYDNGQYNKINYNYLMGYGSNYTAITSGNKALKDEKDLPEITLWEKYLVTATVLGCADKVEKRMKMYITDTSQVDTNLLIYQSINLNLTRELNRSVQSAISNSTSSISSSSYSSGGGFGGGSSGGGGRRRPEAAVEVVSKINLKYIVINNLMQLIVALLV